MLLTTFIKSRRPTVLTTFSQTQPYLELCQFVKSEDQIYLINFISPSNVTNFPLIINKFERELNHSQVEQGRGQKFYMMRVQSNKLRIILSWLLGSISSYKQKSIAWNCNRDATFISMICFQVDGYMVSVYNLGQQDVVVKDTSIRVNDGQYHVVKFIRTGVNSTLQIDDNQANGNLCIYQSLL